MPTLCIQRALEHLDEPGLIAFLRQLVATPSVYQPDVPGANEAAVAQLVYDLLRDWGWQPG